MADKPKSPPKDAKSAQEARRAEALRRNLKRRKVGEAEKPGKA